MHIMSLFHIIKEVRDLLKLVSMDSMQHLVREQTCIQLFVIF